MRANGGNRVGTRDRVRGDGLLQVGGCLFGVVAVLYAFACGPQTPPPQVGTPTFSPEGGSFTDSVDVTIACETEGATIRYTTDGSDPNGSSAESTGAIHLTATTTLNARAFIAGMTDSEVASATFTVAVATPTFTPNGGSFLASANVEIACATASAAIHYTTDGSDPTPSHGTVYGDAFDLTYSATVRAMAYKGGMANSAVGSATFIVKRTRRVSVKSGGAQATDGGSLVPSISSDGRYVAFNSTATDLVTGDTNGKTDVFVHDRDADGNGIVDEAGSGKTRTTRVSVRSDGTQAIDDHSFDPSISSDGRHVAFDSLANDLIVGDTNDKRDIFVHDRDADGNGILDEAGWGKIRTIRVSVKSDGTQATDGSDNASISSDGRYVTFESAATDLLSSDGNGNDDIFVHDRDADGNGIFDEAGPGKVRTTLVSVKSDGTQANGNSSRPSISSDGRYVAFQSFATDLVSGDSNGNYDIFVHDRDADGDGIFDEPGGISTIRVSVKSDGTGASVGMSTNASISSDGRHVAFETLGTDLMPTDTNTWSDVLVHDRDTDGDGIFDEPGGIRTTRVSVASDGTQGVGAHESPSISSDGRYVAFQSWAPDLVTGDTNGEWDIFVHDRDADGDGIFDEPGGIRTTRVSVQSDGTQAASGDSENASISAGGRHVAFDSYAADLVPGDTNGHKDVFVHDRGE